MKVEEKLKGIKEVIFEEFSGRFVMRIDPRFSPDINSLDELGIPYQGTFCGVPCKINNCRDIIEKHKNNLLTSEELEEIGISPLSVGECYKIDDILYIKGNSEIEEVLGRILNL